MAYGVNKNFLLLRSGTVGIGTVANPEDIGSDATRPRDHFTVDTIGSIKAGTQIVNMNMEWVEFLKQTPRQLFRKDLIRAMYSIEGEIGELSADVLATVMNRYVQAAYAVTIPVAETWDIAHVGPDIPPLTEHAILIQTTDVSGENVDIAQYSAIFTPEDLQMNMGGDDYVVTKLKSEATPHANFTTLAEDQRSYGYVAIQRS
jgi:hypothetical protein